MTAHAPADNRDFRAGYRAALGEVVRGLLGVEAERVELDELIAALSGYEEAVEAWLAMDGDASPPAWRPIADELGAGEILLTSIDRDGTRAGFDCDLTAAVSDAVRIPVIASGGAGTPEHFAEVFTVGRADAALAASVFHFAEHAVRDLKQFLAARGVPMRLIW